MKGPPARRPGLTGVKQLDFDSLKGRVVMNLDCSDEGIVVGCAGASVVRLELRGEFERTRREQHSTSCGCPGFWAGTAGCTSAWGGATPT